jgi:glycosyltransferase involved in cell wall biosynthesis
VKGHDLLLDAAALLQARDIGFRLSLAGERTDSAEARAAAAARGLQARVSHLGAIPQTALATLLGSADVLALTSWHEAQCLAVVEALACGVPVVATPVGAARDLLKDTALGRCIERRSPALLADALQAQLERPRGDERQARQRRWEAAAHLALPDVADRLLAAYAGLGER